MGKRVGALVGVGALVMAIWPAVAAPEAKDVAGIWQGTLSAQGMTLRIVVHLQRAADGTLSGTMDSPDQGATGIPIASATVKDGVLRLDVKAVGATYEGTLSADGSAITGKLTQGGMTIPLNLKRLDKAPEVRRPQEPRPPFPYKAEDVSYENKAAGVRIAGTLTVPEGQGPFPAALLIAGSGPNNRNEEVFGHKPFLVLADYLTRRGVAVLRVDKRGVGGTTGDKAKATSADYASDVLAGIAYLKTRPVVDARRIGLIGHSEGGMIAPMVAAKSPDVAYVVLIAGPAVSGEQIILLQGELIARASGAAEPAIKRGRDQQARLFGIVKREKDLKALDAALRRQLMADFDTLTPAERKQVAGHEKQMVDAQAASLQNPWMRYFLTYDPKPALMKVRCPLLAVWGAKDLQVPPTQSLPVARQALKAAGHNDYRLEVLPGLNHLLQPCKTGAPQEYSRTEETMSPAALGLMGDWIAAHTKP